MVAFSDHLSVTIKMDIIFSGGMRILADVDKASAGPDTLNLKS
jgi:hypothetical protein